jgi:hypothetical protein
LTTWQGFKAELRSVQRSDALQSFIESFAKTWKGLREKTDSFLSRSLFYLFTGIAAGASVEDRSVVTRNVV